MMLTIVIPMAGRGSRFASVGYVDPKPLIPINGTPMIKVVIDNLRPAQAHRFIFICQKEHVTRYRLKERFNEWSPGCQVVEIEGVTEGALCTVLAARQKICPGPLMIANSDQFVDVSIDDYLSFAEGANADGIIMTMQANDPKWSYVGLDAHGTVTKVVEKEVISQEATVGIYNFSSSKDFLSSADEMIALGERVNGEFYVAPVYNRLIARGAKIVTYNVGKEADGMYGLGTPSDLDLFLSLPIIEKVKKS